MTVETPEEWLKSQAQIEKFAQYAHIVKGAVAALEAALRSSPFLIEVTPQLRDAAYEILNAADLMQGLCNIIDYGDE